MVRETERKVIPRRISNSILILFALLTTRCPAQVSVASTAPMPETLYNININNLAKPNAWPVEHFSSFRTFSFRWYNIERAPGVWDFSTTDKELRLAEQHGVSPLPLLMGVPDWADKPDDPANAILTSDPYRRNRERSMPKVPAQWETYIRTVATRYKGRIHAYELWNEPETNPAFNQHPEDLVKLIAIAYRILHEVDPSITVVSPALSSGDPVPSRVLENLGKFAAAGIYRYCDVIAYHAYLVPQRPDHATVPPEAIFARTSLIRSVLRRYQVPDKPMWDTEIGWEMLNDDANTSRVASYLGDPLTPALASGFVARTYLLGWAAGWQRIYWYSWNAGGTTLTEQDGSYKICEGAYNAIRDWTLGNRLVAIDRHKDGTWIASLRSPADKPSWILWNPGVRGHVSIPAAWHATSATDLAGVQTPVGGEADISPLPILLQ